MKYGFLNRRVRKKLHIKIPSRGINLKQEQSPIGDDELGLCENVVYSDGLLKTRAGLCTKKENVLDFFGCENAWSSNYKLTGIKFGYGGEQMELVYALVHYEYSISYILTYLIDKAGNSHFIGAMEFLRTNETLFNCPLDVIFHTGKFEGENTIFAFVTLSNANAENEISYVCYKINSKLDGWQRHIDFYIPTVYVNGRGNGYSQALSMDLISSFTPKVVESRNMLNSAFYSYFTSDGCSSSFKLPFNELDNLAVRCELYTEPNRYTSWNILPDQTSQEQDFNGTKIAFNVDRATGTVFFTKAGQSYQIPVCDRYRDNNIKIMACKQVAGGFDAVASCDNVCEFGSSYVFSGGTEKNKVYYTDCENPTYFPVINDNEIGNVNERVTALCNADGRLYAFKEDEIYSLQISGGEALNTTALVGDNGKTFTNPLKFKANCISNGAGLTKKDTLAVIHSNPVWLSKNGEILSLNNGEIQNCSHKISPSLKDLSAQTKNTACAAVWSNYYILFAGNKALVLKFGEEEANYKAQEVACYLWNFPEGVSVMGGFGNENRLFMLCRFKNSEYCYTATLEGDTDTVIEGDLEVVKKIESSITLKKYLLSAAGLRNRINSAVILFRAKGRMKIRVCGKYASREFTLSPLSSGFDAAELLCDIANTDTVGLELHAQDAFAFAGADIYYTEAV